MDIIPLMDIGASIPPNTPALSSSIILYTPNIVIDSDGRTGFPVHLPNISNIQILQCSRTLVSQHAEIDIASNALIPLSLKPPIQKQSSRWHIYKADQTDTLNSSSLLESDSVGTSLLIGTLVTCFLPVGKNSTIFIHF
jgi:hypothetical protein